MKKYLLGFILGGIIFSGITYAATTYLASDIEYSSTKTNKTNVEEALNEIYDKLPSGSQNITANGEYDISKKASINVNVPNTIPDGYLQPSGSQSITSNGEYNISTKASVNVNVSPLWSSTTGWTTYGGTGYKNAAGLAENLLSGLTVGQLYIVQILGGMEVTSYTDNISFSFTGANCTVVNKKQDYAGTKLQNNNYAEWYSAIYYCTASSTSLKIVATNANNYWMWFYSKATKIY